MRVLLALTCLALAPASAAQPEAGGVQTVCRLPVLGPSETAGAVAARRTAPPAPCPSAERRADFAVTYAGFPPDAEVAFQAAVDTWACRIASNETIHIEARWEELDRGTLGSAGPFVFRNFSGAPSPDVWYPAPLADHLAGRDLSEGRPDIEASFNSAFADWHFDLSSAPDRRYDLYTVVLHEIGHGLGLIGAMQVDDGVGRVGEDPEGPFVYDLLTQDGEGRPILDSSRYPDGSVALAGVLQDGVFAFGPAIDRVRDVPIPLYAPARWVQGGSYSHLDEEAFGTGTPDGLMTPFIDRSERVDEPGRATCALLADLGWDLSGACLQLVGSTPAPGGGLTAERRGANPFSSRTTVRIRSDIPRLVSVALYSAQGRRVLDLGDVAVVAGRPAEVEVGAAGLASGVYFLVGVGSDRTLVVPLTVVR